MKWILKKVSEKTNELAQLSKEELAFHALPHFLGDLLSKYFRIEVEGLEHIPVKGRALITANHSGFSGFDVFLLCHHIFEKVRRTPRVLAHHFWFLTQTTAYPAQKMGFIEANKQNGLETLNNDKLLIIFPEGEYGNFKPSTKAYKLQPFKKGFIRLAVETKSPIIPTLVIGAEETHINLAQIKSKYLRGLILPLPLNIIPLPAKWKIKFLPPIYLEHSLKDLEDETLVRHLAEDLQDYMQIELNKELEARKSVFV
ncbi:MAG: acyltransferase family protein [Bdellovibrionales bacterium]|nr:acyltransferase family protein [Bdellovibrionales bacterium]